MAPARPCEQLRIEPYANYTDPIEPSTNYTDYTDSKEAALAGSVITSRRLFFDPGGRIGGTARGRRRVGTGTLRKPLPAAVPWSAAGPHRGPVSAGSWMGGRVLRELPSKAGRVEDARGNLGHMATPRFPSPLIELDAPH